MAEEEEDLAHYSGMAQCRICGVVHCVVIPVETDLPDRHSNMECPNCGHMTCEFIGEEEEEEEESP